VARTLRGEGVTIVRWTPPEEQRGAGEVLDTATAHYVVMGAERLRRALSRRPANVSAVAAPSRTTRTIKEVAPRENVSGARHQRQGAGRCFVLSGAAESVAVRGQCRTLGL
jgi:hypothetical protein